MSNQRKYNLNDIEEYEIPHYVALALNDRVDDYVIERNLGEGTFGMVHKVRHVPTNTSYALKMLKLYQMPHEKERRNMLKRFRREFECGQISSKHLVQSHDFGKIKGNPYIVMDYCANGSLMEKVGKAEDWNAINRWGIEMLEGLMVMHQDGKFHRDIKPENVLFDYQDTIKLTDFGIAGYKNQRMTERNILGATRDIFGTYAYIAPEQADNRVSYKTMNAVTDIFSFGITIYEVLTGKLPFGPLSNHTDLVDYLSRAKKGDWDDITKYRKDVPSHWVEIIYRSLHPDYKRTRFQSVGEIIQLLGHQPITEYKKSFLPGKDKLILQVMEGEERGRQYKLSEILPSAEGIIRVGWYDANDLTKNDIGIVETATAYISNFHATIEKMVNPERWYIRDGQWRQKNGRWAWYTSKNGVLLNSKELEAEGALLNPNDIIMLGDTTLKVIIQK